MKSIPLLKTGVANIFISMAMLDGLEMPVLKFLVDTGATRTTIPKETLVEELGYTEDYIQNSKVFLSDDEKPTMANGSKADVYKVKAQRMNIGGHEIQPEYILTSDTITSLSLLLGLDILRNFKFIYDFDAIDDDAPHGRMFYEFREACITPFTKLGESFAYKISDS